ncbi:hypothetical protein [uncultured Campylobacter sp.]|jgi:hypothetical protein|uniref:hypothetical protein n=2 Tax=uncultured Campylobacter sp. TaxID=218934 RepID=UPI0026284B6D|nr:hypothetical protein [uncultured Campylobacter sp.]
MDKYEKFVLSFFTGILSSALTTLFINGIGANTLSSLVLIVLSAISIFGISCIFFVTNKREEREKQEQEIKNEQKHKHTIFYYYEI